MSEKRPQTYENHTKFVPAFHYVTMPILLLNLLFSLYQMTQIFGFQSLNTVVVALALIVVAVLSRPNALKAQDRVIRLEERLRLQSVLEHDLHPRVNDITTSQLVALRFAPDEELTELVRLALDNGADQKTLKKAIKHWKPDYQRL